MQTSTFLKNHIINHLLREAAYTPAPIVYLALYTSTTTDGGGGIEASGGSYARKAVTFAVADLGETTNTNEVIFPNMAANTYTHAAICTAASGGSTLFHGPLTVPKTTFAGQNLSITPGEIDVRFSEDSNATDYMRNLIIDRFLRNQPQAPILAWMGLYTSATDRLGGGDEVASGSYARTEVDLSNPTDGVTTLVDGHYFFMGADTVTHMALHNAEAEMMLQGPLVSPITTPDGDIIRLTDGAYDLTVT